MAQDQFQLELCANSYVLYIPAFYSLQTAFKYIKA